MRTVTSNEMYEIEGRAIKELGIPEIVLMENAAVKISDLGLKYLKTQDVKKAVIAAGAGNNGGDGLAAARHLLNHGIDVQIIYIGDLTKIKGSAKINFEIAKALNIPIINYVESYNKNEFISVLRSGSLLIDSIFGIGLNREMPVLHQNIIEDINNHAKYIISVDIPSGVCASTGKVFSTAVKANQTISFTLPKIGMILYPGAEQSGECIIEDIGIPGNITDNTKGIRITESTDMKKLMPLRKPVSNKGTYGKLMVIAGSSEMPGACVLACKGAYKSGVGLVNACSTPEVTAVIHQTVFECITTALPHIDGHLCGKSWDRLSSVCDNYTAAVIGPGLGAYPDIDEFIRAVIKNASIPLVIDADALNSIAKAHSPDILKSIKSLSVITPHPGEMSRLTGKNISDILENPIETATLFARQYNVITVLKGARTVIAAPNGQTVINTSGTSALAAAGTGDVLCGIIGAFIAQGQNPFDSAVLGCYIHGRAGAIAADTGSEYSVTASDVITGITTAIRLNS